MSKEPDRKKGFCRKGGSKTYDENGKLIEVNGQSVTKTSANKKNKTNTNVEEK